MNDMLFSPQQILAARMKAEAEMEQLRIIRTRMGINNLALDYRLAMLAKAQNFVDPGLAVPRDAVMPTQLVMGKNPNEGLISNPLLNNIIKQYYSNTEIQANPLIVQDTERNSAAQAALLSTMLRGGANYDVDTVLNVLSGSQDVPFEGGRDVGEI